MSRKLSLPKAPLPRDQSQGYKLKQAQASYRGRFSVLELSAWRLSARLLEISVCV
jgi:hypothetical protein